jgi:hypothetical protein
MMIEKINNKISNGLLVVTLSVAYITIISIETIKFILK